MHDDEDITAETDADAEPTGLIYNDGDAKRTSMYEITPTASATGSRLGTTRSVGPTHEPGAVTTFAVARNATKRDPSTYEYTASGNAESKYADTIKSVTSARPAIKAYESVAVDKAGSKRSSGGGGEYAYGSEISGDATTPETRAMAATAGFTQARDGSSAMTSLNARQVPFAQGYTDAFERGSTHRSSNSSATASTAASAAKGYIHIESILSLSADYKTFADLSAKPPYFHGRMKLGDASARLALGRKPATFMVFQDDTCPQHCHPHPSLTCRSVAGCAGICEQPAGGGVPHAAAGERARLLHRQRPALHRLQDA